MTTKKEGQSVLSWDIQGRVKALQVIHKQMEELSEKAEKYTGHNMASRRNFQQVQTHLAVAQGLLLEEAERYRKQHPKGTRRAS